MTKLERMLKSAKACVAQAYNMIAEETADKLEIQTLRNTATQCSQAATELSQIIGMLDAERSKGELRWLKFDKAEERDALGHTAFDVINPKTCPNFEHMTDVVVEINDELYYVSEAIVLEPAFVGSLFRKGAKVRLVVRAATASEVAKQVGV